LSSIKFIVGGAILVVLSPAKVRWDDGWTMGNMVSEGWVE